MIKDSAESERGLILQQVLSSPRTGESLRDNDNFSKKKKFSLPFLSLKNQGMSWGMDSLSVSGRQFVYRPLGCHAPNGSAFHVQYLLFCFSSELMRDDGIFLSMLLRNSPLMLLLHQSLLGSEEPQQ
jgi:hypothetical protein